MDESVLLGSCFLLLAVAAVLASRERHRAPRRAAFIGIILFVPAIALAAKLEEGGGLAGAAVVSTATLAFVVLLGGRGNSSAG
jgi:Na+/phosphate symporter